MEPQPYSAGWRWQRRLSAGRGSRVRAAAVRPTRTPAAQEATSARLATPSLARMCSTWALTVLGDRQLAGDLPVGHALRHQAGDLELPDRQRSPWLLLEPAAATRLDELVRAGEQRCTADRLGPGAALHPGRPRRPRAGSCGPGIGPGPGWRPASPSPARSSQPRIARSSASRAPASDPPARRTRPSAWLRAGPATESQPARYSRAWASQRSASSGRRAAIKARAPVTTNGMKSARSPVELAIDQPLRSTRPRLGRCRPAGRSPPEPHSGVRMCWTSPMRRPAASDSSSQRRASTGRPRPIATNPITSCQPIMPRLQPRSTSSWRARSSAGSQRPACPVQDGPRWSPII